MKEQPLVTAICPTKNRHAFLPGMIRDFLAQDYPAKELLILDDGADSSHLIPKDDQILYAPTSCMTIGAKRNLACLLGRGSIIVHFDDDDIYLPHRISEQVEVLEETGREVTGYRDMLFVNAARCKSWMYLGSERYVVGVSLAYRKDFWRTHQFDETREHAEDNEFIREIPDSQMAIRTGAQIIARIHPGNTCQKSEEMQLRNAEYWREIV